MALPLNAKVEAAPNFLANCRVPYDHIPIRSWPLIRARDVLRGLIETLKAEQAT